MPDDSAYRGSASCKGADRSPKLRKPRPAGVSKRVDTRQVLTVRLEDPAEVAHAKSNPGGAEEIYTYVNKGRRRITRGLDQRQPIPPVRFVTSELFDQRRRADRPQQLGGTSERLKHRQRQSPTPRGLRDQQPVDSVTVAIDEPLEVVQPQ